MLPLGPISPLPSVPGAETLLDWDIIVLNTSGGKDSQTMLAVIAQFCADLGILDRCVAVHADLGRMEWQGTKEIAEAQAKRWGVRFMVVSRIGDKATRDGKAYKAGEAYGDLLDYVERRGMWPDNRNRFCTSDFKRGPVDKLHTALAREWSRRNPPRLPGRRRPRILNVMGMRAQESVARSKLPSSEVRRDTSGCLVWDWLPILGWTVDQVWTHIRASGVPYHQCYDLGMPRHSCVFCIFAPEAKLELAGRHNPALLADYVGVEDRTGHKFRQKVSLRVIQDRIAANPNPTTLVAADGQPDDGCWNM